MEALVITDIGSTEIREVDSPVCEPDHVILSVQHVGLCGSDLNTYSGLNPLVSLPRIPGHEIGGIITEAGANVPSVFAIGKSAIVIPYTTCGTCSSCSAGRPNACRYNRTLGVQQDGGMSSLLKIHYDRLILNDTLPAKHLSLVEPLSVGFHAVSRGRVAPGETVVVLGGGMIGVGAMLGSLARGAKVFMVEISEPKRKTLLELGAHTVINPEKTDVLAEVSERTGDEGPNVVIEAVGLPQTFRAAVDLASFAGRVVYVGYAKEEVSYNTSLFNLKELDIMGSRNATRADFEDVIRFLEANPTIGDKLISRAFTWTEAEKSFDYWKENRNETFKVIIDVAS
ncbi:zinc-binding alcohol dehydrogenase family protein [Alphaproteobacteria bacterium KMM 3653]|uniref:Zinc-binding alcohol dehydrogenase family protein n=1 Tax=Harenicola maris TaxID=2841044 RepID=A0AAP2G3T6_9RHOB|nr:zinc-binding alcohol dehydrogenase family protein [Harenicola maris]